MTDSKTSQQTSNNSKSFEKVAEQVHELWMGWATRLMHEETLSQERVERWKQCFVPYSELSEEMKDLDRKFAKQLIETYESSSSR